MGKIGTRWKQKMTFEVTEDQLNEIVKKEFEKLYNDAVLDAMSQFLALNLFCLDKTYGWKGKRLKKYIEDLTAIANLITDSNLLGKKAMSHDVVALMRVKYGIDCKKVCKRM